MKHYEPKIKDNYSFYKGLISENKMPNCNTMILSKTKKNHPSVLSEAIDISANDSENHYSFIAEQDPQLLKDFQFKLKCNSFCNSPIIRFDSYGATHRNASKDVPIYEQEVTTPHFHNFNKDGIEEAYKTSVLKDNNQLKALEDISMCASHFFQEANIQCENFDIHLPQGNLPLIYESENDPLANVF